MTESSRIRPGEDIPSVEPWVIALFTAFIPVGLAFVLPKLMWVFFGAAGALFVVATAMLVRQERAKALSD